MPVASLVAHQGGWDELLLVAGPLLVFAAVLFLANRRANAKLAQAAQVPETTEAAEPAEATNDDAE